MLVIRPAADGKFRCLWLLDDAPTLNSADFAPEVLRVIAPEPTYDANVDCEGWSNADV